MDFGIFIFLSKDPVLNYTVLRYHFQTNNFIKYLFIIDLIELLLIKIIITFEIYLIGIISMNYSSLSRIANHFGLLILRIRARIMSHVIIPTTTGNITYR